MLTDENMSNLICCEVKIIKDHKSHLHLLETNVNKHEKDSYEQMLATKELAMFKLLTNTKVIKR